MQTNTPKKKDFSEYIGTGGRASEFLEAYTDGFSLTHSKGRDYFWKRAALSTLEALRRYNCDPELTGDEINCLFHLVTEVKEGHTGAEAHSYVLSIAAMQKLNSINSVEKDADVRTLIHGADDARTFVGGAGI